MGSNCYLWGSKHSCTALSQRESSVKAGVCLDVEQTGPWFRLGGTGEPHQYFLVKESEKAAHIMRAPCHRYRPQPLMVCTNSALEMQIPCTKLIYCRLVILPAHTHLQQTNSSKRGSI